MGKETLKVLSLLTSKIVAIFVHPTMLERISSMLNYFLFKLCGPSRKDLKVADFEKVDFDPAELVAIISKIYLNLQDVDEFCKKVLSLPLIFSIQHCLFHSVSRAFLLCHCPTISLFFFVSHLLALTSSMSLFYLHFDFLSLSLSLSSTCFLIFILSLFSSSSCFS